MLDSNSWISVVRRLRIENRPLLRPGVHCLGTIEKGKRKFLYCNETPQVLPRRRPLKSTDMDIRWGFGKSREEQPQPRSLWRVPKRGRNATTNAHARFSE